MTAIVLLDRRTRARVVVKSDQSPSVPGEVRYWISDIALGRNRPIGCRIDRRTPVWDRYRPQIRRKNKSKGLLNRSRWVRIGPTYPAPGRPSHLKKSAFFLSGYLIHSRNREPIVISTRSVIDHSKRRVIIFRAPFVYYKCVF